MMLYYYRAVRPVIFPTEKVGDPKVKWVTHFVGRLDKKSYF